MQNKLTLKALNRMYRAVLKGKDKPTHYIDIDGIHKI